MEVEFLRAFDTKTWDTITVTVPSNINESELINWAHKNLLTNGIVCFAVYNIQLDCEEG